MSGRCYSESWLQGGSSSALAAEGHTRGDRPDERRAAESYAAKRLHHKRRMTHVSSMRSNRAGGRTGVSRSCLGAIGRTRREGAQSSTVHLRHVMPGATDRVQRRKTMPCITRQQSLSSADARLRTPTSWHWRPYPEKEIGAMVVVAKSVVRGVECLEMDNHRMGFIYLSVIDRP